MSLQPQQSDLDAHPVLHLDTQPSGKLRIVCPRCRETRDFGTKQGAVTWYCDHSIKEHRVRPLFR